MPHPLARLCLVTLCCLFAACGSQNGALLQLDPGPDETGPSPYVAEDPKGPIPAPSLPPGMATANGSPPASAPPSPALHPSQQPRPQEANGETPPSAQDEYAAEHNLPRLSYAIVIVTPDAPELEAPFLAASHLQQMREKPPASAMGLDQRMRSDLETARDVLHSYGYYMGKAHGKIVKTERGARRETVTAEATQTAKDEKPSGKTDAETDSADDYTVTITFEPGTRYTIGKTRVSVTDPQQLKPDPTKGEYTAPGTSLAAVGLKEGDPALAGAVLDAVSAMREQFRDRGYPFASIASSRYLVDHGAQTLDAEIVVDSGPLVYMDGLIVKGESPVKKPYLDALATWESGHPWNQSRVENFRNALRQSGLFTAAELNPAEEEDENGLRAVMAELTPAPARTVGGALKYDTDFGPGVQAYWENRNITGRGDRLRFEMPIWADLQEFLATYRLPFFLRKDQDFTARAAFRNEDTDAYELTSYLAAAGLERRFSPHWTGAIELYVEGGTLKDPDEPETEYLLMGVPTSLAYNNTNSLLDATKGFRLNLAVAPYTGQYHEDFTVVRTRVEAQAFLPVIGEDALVLALRGMYGMISDTNAQDVPASLRFYVGGGGSVRGYEYQSLGPRNDSKDPLGGASAVEFSAEARAKFDDTWGMVAFLDGGMAYADAAADFSEEELRWGAGLGLRFYTAIGPIRLDFAVPLNKRNDDDNFQIYFSIGQSF
ncbi:putative Outer membrane protein, OMP85 family [uncultured delta proteobacterium]|uniref:Putative Outer membrane protein, OMP85 family n=1 Tax=uncultured delta proteobacterium TaxID=34034 RepID=A0A212JGL5_9DELT|nr:putative Outer membrane protein, OMP85 family [uncultured delta proteobacterium]